MFFSGERRGFVQQGIFGEFSLGGKRKSTHGHFKSVLFKIGPSFDHGAHGRQTRHQRAVVQQGTSNHAGGHQE